jgi:mRNA-degrading endonuclease toxin of MazEF toxin-antitoxin module
MNLAQGEIYWVAFPPSDSREQMGRRPALIAQEGVFLQSLSTI